MKITFHGGLNENDGTLPQECQSGSNFDLVQGSGNFRPRRALDLKDTLTQAGPCNGIMQLVTKADVETTIVFEADATTPTIYLWDGTTLTSKRTASLNASSKLRDTYWPLDEYIILTDLNKATPILKWDGTTCERLKNGLAVGTPVNLASITRVTTTATLAYTLAHGLAVGDIVHVADAVETDYNGEVEILTVPTTATATYAVTGAPASPATGTPTADDGVKVYAKYSVRHQGRIWFFNITTDAALNPHMMVATAFEDPTSLDTTLRAKDASFSTGNEAFYMLTKDLKGINGVTVFMDRLILSTDKGQLFELTGSDSTDYAWAEFYQGSAATGTESIVNIGNDVIFMREGGNIELLSSTQNFGDVAADDVSRWIPDTVQDLSDSQIIYDKTLQKVLFFVANKCLVLFKDVLSAKQVSPWSVYETTLTFNMNVNSARYLRRPGESTWSVYVGDSTGNIYDMNGGGAGDEGTTNVLSFRKNQLIHQDPEENLNTENSMLQGRVQYRRIGSCELNTTFDWSDAFNLSGANITLNGPSATNTPNYYGEAKYYGESHYYNEGFFFVDKVANNNFSPTGKADSFFMELSLDTKVRFKIDHIILEAN